MYFENYEICAKELRKALIETDKYERAIDPAQVVEGTQHLANCLCKGCNKLPLEPITRQCSSCKSLICKGCYARGMTVVMDSLLEGNGNQDGNDSEEDGMGLESMKVLPDCPVCDQTLRL